MKEKPKKEKEQKQKYQIELEQRPQPLKGESFDKWLERIGGPNVNVVEALEEHPLAEKKEDRPLLIDKTGNFVVNSKNIGIYFDKVKIDKRLEEKDPNVLFIKENEEYQLRKELFGKPEAYLQVVAGELKENRKIVADKGFGKSLEKWDKDSLNEQIAQKEQELKQAEEEQALYKPIGWFHKKPVVKDLGYYANQSTIEGLRKEIDELEKKLITSPEIKQEEKPKEEKPVKEDSWIYKLGKKIREQRPREIFKKIIGKTKEGIDFIDKERVISRPVAKERIRMEKRLVEIDKNLKNIPTYFPKKLRRNRILNQTFLDLTKERMELKKRLKKLTKK